MDLKLNGRIAFVTGASRGIGRAIAIALAEEGVHLALFGRDTARCEALAAELRAKHAGLRVCVTPLDLAQAAATTAGLIAAAQQMGGIDILVNCAGGAYRGRLNEIPDEAWESYFAVKPLGLIRMTREALPYLKQSKQGRVINISGTRGREPGGVSVMSGPINLGTLSITKALANEFGPLGITVNAICPGSTDTGRWTELVNITARERGVSVAEATQHLVREVPLGRVVVPEDIAGLAVYLASGPAAMITGTAINVDGGRTRGI
jgi:3-oxoacyl-[acyl-carrier protein] reductase